MNRKHIHLLFVCWLAYATVPVINYIGVFNGIAVMLCVTKGVMIHDVSPQISDSHNTHHSNQHSYQQPSHQQHAHDQHAHHQQTLQQTSSHLDHHAHHISSNDASITGTSADDHEAEKCPCIHYSFDTTLFLVSEIGLIKASEPIADTFHVSPITTVYAAQARGPPSLHLIQNKFTTFT